MPDAEVGEPIAIVGLGCRFPGANSTDEFWRLLSSGGTSLSRVPPERWDADELHSAEPGAPGTYIVAAPFLSSTAHLAGRIAAQTNQGEAPRKSARARVDG